MGELRDIPAIPGYRIDGISGDVYGPRKKLKTHTDKNGYKFVRVSVDGQGQTAYLHQMQAWAHYGLPPAGWQIRFADGDPSNTAIGNIYYDKPGPRMGRLKTATKCRKGHRLSMTGEPDENTVIWGYGNRQCVACAGAKDGPRMRADEEQLNGKMAELSVA